MGQQEAERGKGKRSLLGLRDERITWAPAAHGLWQLRLACSKEGGDLQGPHWDLQTKLKERAVTVTTPGPHSLLTLHSLWAGSLQRWKRRTREWGAGGLRAVPLLPRQSPGPVTHDACEITLVGALGGDGQDLSPV